MALEIIGPGFGRTGTSSLKTALEHLGFGPCHHMFEVRDHESQLPGWEAAARGEPIDWQELFAGYRAQVDWPGARYWRELIKAFPDARVILTVRDPETWHQSVLRTILPFVEQSANAPNPYIRRLAEMASETVITQVFGGRLADKDTAIQVFNAHIAEVQAFVPPENLLIFNVEQGWEPLCRFLGVDVPTISFPHLNSSQQFHEKEWASERGSGQAAIVT